MEGLNTKTGAICINESHFYDTNILVYAYDESEAEKRRVSEKLVEKVFAGEAAGIISNQVLSEMFYVLTEGIAKPLEPEKAAKIVRKYVLSEKWKKINYTQETVLKAVQSTAGFKSAFWDTLIAETMRENNTFSILTENVRDFKKLPGIKVINPFNK